mgnify:CR=1 FL=1
MEDYPRKKLLFRERYSYDVMGNLSEKIAYVNQQERCTKYTFDGLSQLIEEMDADKNKTTYEYLPVAANNGCLAWQVRRLSSSGLESLQQQDIRGCTNKVIHQLGKKVLEESN